MSMNQKIMKINPKDNVIVALDNLNKNETVTYQEVQYLLVEDIPAKHKFFMQDMKPGEDIIMYGVLVGKAQKVIGKGSRMSTENTKHAAEPYTFRPGSDLWQKPDITKFSNRTFNGYHRADGTVGTANYWLFIPTVFCENRNLDVIREALYQQLGYAVTDKYKQKTQMLVELYKSGKDITSANLEIKESIMPTNRVFKNVDGI